MKIFGNRTGLTEMEKLYRRTNRRTFVVEVLLIFAIVFSFRWVINRIGVSALWVDILLVSILLVLISRAFAGRSHDLGRSDFWTFIPVVLFAAGCLTAFFWTGAPVAVQIISYLLCGIALVSVALMKGDQGENRFGASPEEAIELKVIGNMR